MTLAALLPPSSTPLERAAADALAVCTDPSIIRRYHHPDSCPVELLPLLAWERHVDGADSAATPDQLRELIKHSFELHRLRGTPWAVLTALAAIGYPRARLTEWWEQTPQGQRGTFRVTLPWQPALSDAAEWARIKSAVAAYKNVRSWPEWSTVVVAVPVDDLPDDPEQWPKTQIIHPRASAAMGIVQVRQPARRVPLVIPRAGAGVGVVRIRHAARVAQIIQPRAGAAMGIVRLGTLPADSWQTWARPLGDVDAFRRGLLHGWTTRQPRTWRDGNFDSHALVALLRSKFGV